MRTANAITFLQSVKLGRFGIGLLVILLTGLAFQATLHPVDFPVYHTAAREVINGTYALYPVAAHPGDPLPPHGFRYAPAIAFLFVPFGWLPLEVATFVFLVLKALACVYVGTTVARHAGVSTNRRRVLFIGLLFVAGYVAEEFRYGNFHFFALALMVAAYDGAESGRVWSPAVGLALAIATKITPVLLLGYFALRRRLALCWATAAVLLGLMFLPAVIVGQAGNIRLLKSFFTYALEKVDEQGNYSIRGVLVRYLTSTLGADPSHLDTRLLGLSPETVTILWVLAVGVLGLVSIAVVWRDTADPSIRLLEFCLVLTAILLTSPHTQRIYFVSLYVPSVTLVGLLSRRPPEAEARVMRWGLAATVASGTILPLLFGGKMLSLVYEATSAYFFGTAILFATLLWITAYRKNRPQSATLRP